MHSRYLSKNMIAENPPEIQCKLDKYVLYRYATVLDVQPNHKYQQIVNIGEN